MARGAENLLFIFFKVIFTVIIELIKTLFYVVDVIFKPRYSPKTHPSPRKNHAGDNGYVHNSRQPPPSYIFPDPKNRKAYRMAVVGESHNNADGSSRQSILFDCRPGEPMKFVPEPDNPHDPEAIAVCRLNGQQVGYVSRDDIEFYSNTNSQKIYEIFACRISHIHGGNGKMLGCVLQLLKMAPIEDPIEVAKNPDRPDRIPKAKKRLEKQKKK